jgi:hypothetical protein
LVSAFRESPISQSIYDLAGIASNRPGPPIDCEPIFRVFGTRLHN